jgi:peptidoglycan/LPS O-acetylase OafA/YrhL
MVDQTCGQARRETCGEARGEARGEADPATTADERPEARSARHHNSFGLLRLVLASLVILQHALALTGHESLTLLGIWQPRVSIGDLAVGGFFGLSGYLLHASVTRHSPGRFLRLRFFRLFPGFWGTLLFVAFVAAPLVGVGTGHWSGYRLFGADSAVSYVGLNAALVVLQHGIGTLLAGNPWPTAFDGSLWSLAPEFACYLTLLIATMIARRLRRPPSAVLIPLVLLAAVAQLTGNPVIGPVLGAGVGTGLTVLGGLAVSFFSGSLLAHLGWLRTPNLPRAMGILAATVAVIVSGVWAPLGPVLLAATVVSVGTSLTTGWTTRVDARADLSYGVYLYHFIVIQALIAFGWTGLSVTAALAWLAPVTLLITAVLAAGSWFAIEAPAQRYGRRRTGTQRSRTPTGASLTAR